MPEEMSAPAPTQESAPATPPAPADATGEQGEAAAAAPAPGPANWTEIIDKLSPEELLRHPRVGGILGDRLQKARDRLKAEWETERTEQAATAERERLKKLRHDDPVAYAELMETREAQEEQERELARVRGKASEEFARQIGQAVQTLPEWTELSPEDLGEIAASLANKADSEVLGTYTTSVIRKLSERRTAKTVGAEVAKRLATEKAAWRQEWEAERLKAEPAPEIRRAAPPTRVDPTKLTGKAFNDWYEKHVLGR